MCVVTTRVPVVDLTRFHRVTVREETLDHLSDRAAAQLLHQAGARRAGEAEIGPDDEELLAAARELDGHALAVQLLGGYLKHAHGGDIRRRDRVDWKRAFDEEQEGHAWAVLDDYERWFEQHGERGQRQLAALRLLGFFDRPADADCLDALRGGDIIPGLTEPLAGLSGEDWTSTLIRLADDHRLISLLHYRGRIEQIDAHPVLREYFAAQLRQENSAAWTEGHRRLYEHLCETTEHQPDTLDGLQPLYQAVAHGCQAGLHQEACVDVYRDRILRGTGSGGNYSTFELGAVGADLGAIACFFDHPWSRLSPNLSAPVQAWLLSEAAFSLRALGRLTDAVEPMRTGLDMAIEDEDWPNVAIRAGNLSELELTLGDVAASIADAEQSVTFADRSGDEGQRIITRTTHADALHQAGRRDESRKLFAEAETMQAEDQPEYPRLYSVQGFQYCDLLLSGAEREAWLRYVNPKSKTPDPESLIEACDHVSERATEIFKWRKLPQWNPAADSLLGIALDHLTLGRATLYRGLCSPSEILPAGQADSKSQIQNQLNAAVDGLRESGAMNHLPRGLLTRAWQRQWMGDASGAAG